MLSARELDTTARLETGSARAYSSMAVAVLLAEDSVANSLHAARENPVAMAAKLVRVARASLLVPHTQCLMREPRATPIAPQVRVLLAGGFMAALCRWVLHSKGTKLTTIVDMLLAHSLVPFQLQRCLEFLATVLASEIFATLLMLPQP